MSTAICCPEQLRVIRSLSVGDYVWIKARRVRKQPPANDDINSFLRLATGLDLSPSGVPIVK